MASDQTPAEWLEQQARDLEPTEEYQPTEWEIREHQREIHKPRGK